MSLNTPRIRAAALALALAGTVGLTATPALAKDQSGIVASEIAAIASQLGLKPSMAIDLTKVSDEYCFDGNLKKGGHMSHYSTKPMSTQEDVIDFVNVKQLVAAGLDVDKLPRHNGKLGSMKPNQWYYLPAGEYEPHHGKKLPFPVMIRAINVK